MEISPQWIALIGAAVGATAATASPLLNGFVGHKRERRLRKREEKLKRFEEIYERLAALDDAIHTKYHRSVVDLMGGRGTTKVEPPNFSRLDMLVGFYAPEVAAEYHEIRDRVWHLYGEYVEFLAVAEMGRMGDHKKRIIDHSNSWMIVVVAKLGPLQEKIAVHARTYEL